MKTKALAMIALAVLSTVDARADDAPPSASVGAAVSAAPPGSEGSVALQPRAIEILRASSARLAAARSMSFTATASYESPSRLGPPLVYTTLSQVSLKRPDKLKVITPGDGPASEFYYDGKVMMAYEPASNLVAIAQAPSTIDAALKVAFDSAAIYFPFTDVIVADPYADLAPTLKRAFYIGQSHVAGGTTTDMIGIVTDTLFGQLWIGAEDKLPRGYRATFLDDPSRLRQEVDFSHWRLDGVPDDEAFTSSAAANARRISFARPDPVPPAGLGGSGAEGAAKSAPTGDVPSAEKGSER